MSQECAACNCSDKSECPYKNAENIVELKTIEVTGQRPVRSDWLSPDALQGISAGNMFAGAGVPSAGSGERRRHDRLIDRLRNVKNRCGERIRLIGVEIVARELSDPKSIELLIADSGGKPYSPFGHIAVAVGGIAFGMNQESWEIEPKAEFIRRYNKQKRDVFAYRMEVKPADTERFTDQLLNQVTPCSQYDFTQNSCSSNMVQLFDSVGMTVADKRWNFKIPSPSDINRFLNQTVSKDRVRLYPTK